jgi:hypothetical protein
VRQPHLLLSDNALEGSSRKDYDQVMSSTADRATVPAGWVEGLERSKAQIAAGMTVPLIPILDRLRASAERLEAADNRPQDEAETPSAK